MRRLSRLFALALAAALLLAPRGAAHARSSADVFALIITNNRSANLERTDLQYADDDGARYHQMFRGVASAERVHLLTRFDRATAALYPALAGSVAPPRLAAVKNALAAIETGVAESRRRGRRTQFYFVYAGHGDVDAGSGYLDLEDGRIDSSFLEREVVDRVAADAQHIVLDSCNSFFVVNPRKPGGRRWATPKDMALGFAQRHPGVGLFLSTNSEAEVYEWSELESGIFSHEVRSGLSGAADVNGDGQVSYAELAGFVNRANARLPRPSLRPQIFYRGPAGDGAAALFDLATAEGRRLTLGDDERRLWIRGATGERLIDLHKERGPMTVLIPARPEQELSVVERLPGVGPDDRPALREYQIPSGSAAVSLSELAPERATSASRGGSAMFGQLFSAAYGPQAFAAFVKEAPGAEETVYGIRAADEARMRHYLTFIAASDRDISRMQALTLGGFGVVITGAALASYFSQPRWGGSPAGALTAGALGLTIFGASLRIGLSKPLGQRALEAFEDEVRRSPGNRALAVAKTESYLDGLARQEVRARRVATAAVWTAAAFVAVVTTAGAVAGDANAREPVALAIGYGTAGLLALSGALIVNSELPTQRLLRLYRTDPDLKASVGVVPVPGGAALSLSGRF